MGIFTKSLAPQYIIVGLGNPGKKYEKTRHNAGFMVIDYLCQKQGVKLNKIKFKGLSQTVVLGSTSVLLLTPQTYMNLSGESVLEAAQFYKIEPSNIIVICDDKELDCGRLRIREKGSSGGQNGLKSIIECIGTQEFPRIRVGIGKKPHPDMDTADFVLSTFLQSEREPMFKAIEHAAEAVVSIVNDGVQKAQEKFNRAI